MKQTVMLIMASLVMVFAYGCGSGQPVADYIVSPTGNDDGPGTVDEPFLTLEQARNAVRLDIERGLTHDITVLVRGGTYFRHKTLWFGPADSGTTDFAITYAAWPGEEVNLIGGVKVTGWEQGDDGIWSAPMPDGVLPILEITEEDGETREGSVLLGAGMRTMQLTEDSIPLTLACYPENGELEAELRDGPIATSIMIEPDVVDVAAISVPNLSVAIREAPGWYTQILPVVGYNADSGQIDLATKTIESSGDCRIVIRNVLRYLDSPGEYYIDRPGRRVLVRPRTGGAPDHEYVASAAGSIIAVEGDGTGRPVRNLHFRGFNLSLATGDVIVMSGVEDCSVRECLIEYGHESGIALRGHARDITIMDNLIRHTGSYGILMEGNEIGMNGGNTVENNRIHGCGELYGHGSGIMLYLCSDNTIAHNELYNMSRSGIAIGSIPLRPSWDDSTAFPETGDDIASDNYILSNRIDGVMVNSGDGGSIDSRNAGSGTVIDRNLITDIGNDAYEHLAGIRIDGTRNNSLTRNIISGLDGSGQLIEMNGSSGDIANNILICPESGADVCVAAGGITPDSDLRFTRNIVVFEGQDGIAYDFNGLISGAVADSNLYYKPAGGPFWPRQTDVSTFGEWQNDNISGYDRHSIAADPKFNGDAVSGLLDTSSPAHSIGFEPVDTGDIGLTGSFPTRFGEL